MIVIAYLAAQAHALPPMLVDSNSLDWTGSDVGDPLDPSFVGETMDMPMDQDTLLQAKALGIIMDSTDSNSLYKEINNPSVTYLGSTPRGNAGSDRYVSDAANAPEDALQDVNVTGPWSLDLIALDQVMKHLNLALVQNKDAIIGYGTLSTDNETHKIIANGLQKGSRLALAVTPIDSKDLYQLDLSLDMHPIGTYTDYSASGEILSGDIAGSAPIGVLISASKSEDAQSDVGFTRSQGNTVKNTAADFVMGESGTIRIGKGKIL